jgi:uncharacterized protein (TIGR02246 family)
MKHIRRAYRGIVVAISVAAGCSHAAERPPVLSPAGAEPGAAASSPAAVHVPPPTGERAADRASILRALEQVRPGGTVRFAAGTYLIGEIISITTPEITLLGHPGGTTLRGCNDADFTRDVATRSCNGLELGGRRQTVRNIAFENVFWGLHLGCCWGEWSTHQRADGSTFERPNLRPTEGGHLVEGNTFRRAASGIRLNGDWTDPAVVRHNRFIDNWHGISINGHTVHLLDNEFSVAEPQRVPFFGFPWDAISISPSPPLLTGESPPTCIGNVVAGNRIEGYIDGVRIGTSAPGSTCRDNIIRDNTIEVARVLNPDPTEFNLREPADSTFIGVPIALQNDLGSAAALERNVIEGNRILGAEGIAIEVRNASGTRIANNTIVGVRVREPYPGNTMGGRGAEGLPLEWDAANGSGIWVSPGSDENEIAGNTFKDVAGDAIVIEGDRNRVETRSASDVVRDLGSGNRVVGAPPPLAVHEEVEALTARFLRALNDESWRPLAPFYAPDAVLTLPQGGVLAGRKAILHYFRPMVARIRSVEATASVVEGDERTVTVATIYTARFAPVPDPVSATFSNTWARQPDGSWLIVAGTFQPPGDPEVESHGTIRSGFFHSDGVRLHYLDFGGEGVPVVFISSGDRTAYAFTEFAPRFTDRNRVLALSQRGAGPSQGDPAPFVAADVLGRDIVALLDDLGIERAVVAHMWERVLVYLAEQHPERVAGVVFLGGFPRLGFRVQDPLGINAMLARNRAAYWGVDPDATPSPDYEFRFLRSGEGVGVPSLLFVDENRTEDSEWEQLIEFAGFADRIPALFPDSLARAYFERLAADVEMQERGKAFWRDTVEPVQRAAEEAFHRAFGGVLRTAPVEARAIGYGYRDAPDLIEPHIRAFLTEVRP